MFKYKVYIQNERRAERGRGGGRDIGGDEGAVREIDPVASRLCGDAFDRIDNPIGRGLLQIGVDGDYESRKDCRKETCLRSSMSRIREIRSS